MSRNRFEQKLTYPNNTILLFKYIKTRNDNSGKISRILDPNGNITENSKDMANIFNKYFNLVYNSNNTSNAQISFSLPQMSQPNLLDSLFIKTCFSKIKNKQYKGHDNIPTFLYINLFSVFGDFYTHLFNTFITENFIPKIWKYSVVTPLYKKSGLHCNFENYRPISKNCSFARFLKQY